MEPSKASIGLSGLVSQPLSTNCLYCKVNLNPKHQYNVAPRNSEGRCCRICMTKIVLPHREQISWEKDLLFLCTYVDHLKLQISKSKTLVKRYCSGIKSVSPPDIVPNSSLQSFPMLDGAIPGSPFNGMKHLVLMRTKTVEPYFARSILASQPTTQ